MRDIRSGHRLVAGILGPKRPSEPRAQAPRSRDGATRRGNPTRLWRSGASVLGIRPPNAPWKGSLSDPRFLIGHLAPLGDAAGAQSFAFENMTSTNTAPPSSVIRGIVFAWIAYAGLWVFLLVSVQFLGPIAVALFDLGLFLVLLATVIVTARALYYLWRSPSTRRRELSITVLSAVGVVGQLLFIKFALPAPF